MHRLVIVSGPNRGSSFALIDGENSIGRQMDNHIVLSSGKVSKRHCAVLVTGNEIFLRDEGSTNGTFVNGTLVRKLPLKTGDKVGVGDFVMELVSPSLLANVAPAAVTVVPEAISNIAIQNQSDTYLEEPQDLPGKIKFIFENKFMPILYGNLMKNEYKAMVATVFAILVGVSVIASVMPMADLAEKSIQREAMIRAKVLAREVADRFAPAIAAGAESQIDLSFLNGEESVKMVVITDPNLQIIAPQSRLNQILGGGKEAAFAMLMAKEFKEGREKGMGVLIGDSIATFVEPMKLVNPRQVKAQVGALVVVSIDFSGNLLAAGGLGVAYGTGFVIAGLLGVLAFFILMRLTHKPLEVLNDDLDQVLRGELPKVTHEFKIEELNPLWNNINAAIQRIPRGGSQEFQGSSEVVNWDQESAGIRAICESSQYGFLAFDSKMVAVAMNPQFEEMSGIRNEVVGQTIQQFARDQALVHLTKDMSERIGVSPSRSALDEFEFSGVAYVVVGVGIGPMTDSGFVLIFKKKE